MPGYVLDTSAVLGYLFGEQGADLVEAVLRAEESAYLPFIGLMEAEYRLIRRYGSQRAEGLLRVLESWPVKVRESDPAWRRAAAGLKARGALSVADAWIASLAILEDARLVHKDPEFDRVRGLQTLRLP